MSVSNSEAHAALLVEQAQKAGLGEEVAFEVVEAALLALAAAPEGGSALAEVVSRVNDPGLVKFIRIWCERVAQNARDDARQAARMCQQRAVPLRNGALGVSGACLLALTLGTMTLTGGAGLFFVGGLVVAGGAATAADVLQGRENGHISRADRVAALCNAL